MSDFRSLYFHKEGFFIFKAGDLYREKYYVYEHILDGKVFYVGKGVRGRAVEFRGRNPLWNIVVKERLSEVEVKILANFKTDSEARKYEKRHIKKLSESGVMLTNFIYNTTLYDNLKLLGVTQKDIKYILKKEEEKLKSVEIEKSTVKPYLNIPLIVSDKRALCDELNILDNKGKLRKWTSVKKYIQQSGYEIEDRTKTINGKRMRVSIITIEES